MITFVDYTKVINQALSTLLIAEFTTTPIRYFHGFEKKELAKKEKPMPEIHKAAPEVKPEVKEQKVIEDVKKEKAKKEEKKIEKKRFFTRFFRRRTNM